MGRGVDQPAEHGAGDPAQRLLARVGRAELERRDPEPVAALLGQVHDEALVAEHPEQVVDVERGSPRSRAIAAAGIGPRGEPSSFSTPSAWRGGGDVGHGGQCLRYRDRSRAPWDDARARAVCDASWPPRCPPRSAVRSAVGAALVRGVVARRPPRRPRRAHRRGAGRDRARAAARRRGARERGDAALRRLDRLRRARHPPHPARAARRSCSAA